jgi:hypothetical protein
MDTRDCAECGHLWRIYAQVTSKHIALVNQQRAAYIKQDFDLAARLDAEIEEVGRQRQAAGDAVYHHEVKEHQRLTASGATTPRRGAGQ